MSRHDLERMTAESKRATKPRNAPAPKDGEQDPDLRSAVGNAGMGHLLDPSIGETIEAELGGGKPLRATAGAQRSAGAQGEEVRIHDDGTAAELSRELGAVAFTYGRDIFLAGNSPDLRSDEGQAMLRHELTHVEQQAESGTTRPKRVSAPDSPAEKQAAHAQHGAVAGASSAGASAVHRQEEEELVELMPVDTVHRQEEEELVELMPVDTVHRQEEEEEEELAMPMAADTVHRQEELPEEELAMMPADTVHRQLPEDEVEEAAQEATGEVESAAEEAASEVEQAAQEASGEVQAPGEQDANETAAPANPALAALWEHTVVASVREAMAAMAEERPNAHAALDALHRAWPGMSATADSYEGRDPLLSQRIKTMENAVAAIVMAIEPLAGVDPDENWIRDSLTALASTASGLGADLH